MMVFLEDASGDVVECPTDVINDDVTYVYTNGQCLALAVALAEKMTGTVVIETCEEETGEWDDDADAPEMFTNIVHAYALHEDGSLWDVNGQSSAQTLPTFSTVEAIDLFSGYMSTQNYEVARQIASLVRP